MLVVADVNISQDEVEFLRGIEAIELVVYVAQDLRRSIPDEEMVEYALENNALIVTRDKGFNLGVGIIHSIHPHLFLAWRGHIVAFTPTLTGSCYALGKHYNGCYL